MQYRGIYPHGLMDLGVSLGETVRRLGGTARPCLDVMTSNGLAGEAALLADGIERISRWGEETAAELQTRAEMIRRGQSEQTDVWAALGARYAITALVSVPAWKTWDEGQPTAETVARDVSRWLEQRWNDWDVTNTDLHNIRDGLSGLDDLERTLVIATLTPAQLQRWIEEMGNQGNGFSRDEKRDVFQLLAAGLSGDQLQRVHAALLESGAVTDLVDFGFAIQVHSPDAAIAEFVTTAIATDLDEHRFSTIAPALATSGIETPALIRQVTRAMIRTDGALELVIADSLVVMRTENIGQMCVSVDPLASFVTALRDTTDTKTTATAFSVIAAAAGKLDGLVQLLDNRFGLMPMPSLGPPLPLQPEHPTRHLTETQMSALLDAATILLMSDIDGVVSTLATTIDPAAELLSGYLHQLIDTDRIADLAGIAAALRGGVEVDPARFSTPGQSPEYPYPHAQNLAYLAGAMTNALRDVADDARTQIDVIGTVASLLSGAITPLFQLPARVGLATTLGELAGDWVVFDNAEQKIDNSLAAVTREVTAAMQPNPDNTVSVSGGDLAWQAWVAMFRKIVPTNKK